MSHQTTLNTCIIPDTIPSNHINNFTCPTLSLLKQVPGNNPHNLGLYLPDNIGKILFPFLLTQTHQHLDVSLHDPLDLSLGGPHAVPHLLLELFELRVGRFLQLQLGKQAGLGLEGFLLLLVQQL